jgi:hypothetical protein
MKNTQNKTNKINSLDERRDVTCSEERTELSQSSGSPLDIHDRFREILEEAKDEPIITNSLF